MHLTHRKTCPKTNDTYQGHRVRLRAQTSDDFGGARQSKAVMINTLSAGLSRRPLLSPAIGSSVHEQLRLLETSKSTRVIVVGQLTRTARAAYGRGRTG